MSDFELTLLISAVIFIIGSFGVLLRRNPLVQFMSIELMLNAVNLAFLSFARGLNNAEGQVFVFLVMTVAAAEAVVGLGIIVSLFRRRAAIDVDDINTLHD